MTTHWSLAFLNHTPALFIFFFAVHQSPRREVSFQPEYIFIFIHAHLFALHFFHMCIRREKSQLWLFCKLMCDAEKMPATLRRISKLKSAHEHFPLIFFCAGVGSLMTPRALLIESRARILTTPVLLCQPWQKLVSYCPARARHTSQYLEPTLAHMQVINQVIWKNGFFATINPGNSGRSPIPI